MSDNVAGPSDVKPPWFAGRIVPVLMYRINRRPHGQQNFFAEQPTNFMDHLEECLLFGEEVSTTRRGKSRRWKLGNHRMSPDLGSLSGWVGFQTEDTEELDDYDEDTASYQPVLVETPRRAVAPFAVAGATRILAVAKHPSFAEGTLPRVFETLLNRGERARQQSTTDWSVEPILDAVDFENWLRDTAVVDQVTFTVKRPNPDASESFEQLDQHLRTMRIGELVHRMKPADPEAGLAKDFDQDPMSQGLMEMARRSFARVRARGKSIVGTARAYDQQERVRREQLPMPDSREAAADELLRWTIERVLDDDE